MTLDEKARAALLKRVRAVQIFADESAFRVEHGRSQYLNVKECHDDLFQLALDLYLATYVVFLKGGLRNDIVPHTVVLEHPLWWAANRAYKNRDSLIRASLKPFDRDWRSFRATAEKVLKGASLWHQDPALFEKQHGTSSYLCRTCSIGHEGQLYYFVYPYETEWRDAVMSQGFKLFGVGESAYRELIPDIGQVGGR
jgi:hypothetical protein